MYLQPFIILILLISMPQNVFAKTNNLPFLSLLLLNTIKSPETLSDLKSIKPLLVEEIVNETLMLDGNEVEINKGIIIVYLNENISPDTYENLLSIASDNGFMICGYDGDLLFLQFKKSETFNYSEAISFFKNIEGVGSVDIDVIVSSFATAKCGNEIECTSEYGYFDGSYNWWSSAFESDDWITDIEVTEAWDLWLSILNSSLTLYDTRVGMVGSSLPIDLPQYESRLTYTNHDLNGSHATSVMHIIGAKKNEEEGFGVFWGGKLYARGVSGTASSFASATNTIIKNYNVDVVNISAGAMDYPYRSEDSWIAGQRNFRWAQRKAVKAAFDKDVIVVYAAGNRSVIDNDLFPADKVDEGDYVDSVNYWKNQVITVGGYNYAVNQPDSNLLKGEVVDIYTKQLVGSRNIYGTTQNELYGTSFAAPLVTGSLALLKSIYKNKSMSDIRTALLEGAGVDSSDARSLNVAGAVTYLGEVLIPPPLPCKAGGSQTVTWNGRLWQRCDDGNGYNLGNAAKYCESLIIDGYSDWRLPTNDELKSLVVCSNGTPTPLADYPNRPFECDPNGDGSNPYVRPTIDPSFECNLAYFWTSTQYDATHYRAISFGGGAGYFYPYNPFHVRCTR